ncbi:NAD(P)H dehydrogenase (quinone) [Mucilaginibacter pineti]|uniref:NAD(P)H dehydrogenase (Quinone) n=1 Tax=Mucilaginibacter pineti TaxID=1391627 RepID=A0A1G7LLB5_9SPHI|nr:SDR family oxidoreductase [Mucilaginibacter pineti]SDF49790.1 NAD(P)H dehydrogenase (quinone) [Mucilaginibacter pineti]
MGNILITGATGHLGKAVINELISRDQTAQLSAMVRDLSKAHELDTKGVRLVQGDYNDHDSLVAAFQGVDKLYFVSGSDVAHRSRQHENIIQAAKAAKVGHVIYTSFQRKTEDGSSPIAFVAQAHLLAEKLIKASGLTYTILKHALYADVLPMFMGDQVLNTGTIFLPAGEGKCAYTSRLDMAAAGAAVLTGTGHENKTYEIAVAEAYSFYDIAALLTELSGKQVHYAAPDVETFTGTLKQVGVPDEAIMGAATFCQAIAQGEFDFPGTELEQLIGRKPETLKEFLKNAYQL